jgi:hypothetical protein
MTMEEYGEGVRIYIGVGIKHDLELISASL